MTNRVNHETATSGDQMPHFSLRFSPLAGVQVSTNIPKEILIFELEKFILSLKVSSPPFEAYSLGKEPGAGLTKPA